MQDILISVLVISYNSEKYILETLESVKNQTYNNVELVISDDNSTDHTYELAIDWLEKNNSNFNSSKIIKAINNTGIAPNINRGIKECNGRFIKPIAADDILMQDCLEKNIEFCLENNVMVLFSKCNEFEQIAGKREHRDIEVDQAFFELSSKGQLKKLMLENRLEAPTGFYDSCIFQQIGLFNETYPFLEDYPYWITLTLRGYKLNFMDYVTVLYRKHEESTQKINLNHFNDLYKFYQEVRKPYLIRHRMFLALLHNEVVLKFKRNKINNNGKSTTLNMAFLLLSPIKVYGKIIRELKKLND